MVAVKMFAVLRCVNVCMVAVKMFAVLMFALLQCRCLLC
jgi:hypothetical protein